MYEPEPFGRCTGISTSTNSWALFILTDVVTNAWYPTSVVVVNRPYSACIRGQIKR